MNNNLPQDFHEEIDKFLNDFIAVIYKGHDHIVARKYYQELFRELIPKYFCLCTEKEKNSL